MFPDLNVRYDLLYDGWQPNDLDMNNHRVGFSFSFPLLLRNERGRFNEVKLDLDNIDFEAQNRQNELLNRQKGHFEQLTMLETVLGKQRELTEGFDELLQNENRRFEAGESTMFILNTRQQRLLNAQLKYIDTQGRWFFSWLDLVTSTGRLQEILE